MQKSLYNYNDYYYFLPHPDCFTVIFATLLTAFIPTYTRLTLGGRGPPNSNFGGAKAPPAPPPLMNAVLVPLPCNSSVGGHSLCLAFCKVPYIYILGIRIRRILPCAENKIKRSPAALEIHTSITTTCSLFYSVYVFVYRTCAHGLHPHRGNRHKEEMS